jgi:hypothetical protein
VVVVEKMYLFEGEEVLLIVLLSVMRSAWVNFVEAFFKSLCPPCEMRIVKIRI